MMIFGNGLFLVAIVAAFFVLRRPALRAKLQAKKFRRARAIILASLGLLTFETFLPAIFGTLAAFVVLPLWFFRRKTMAFPFWVLICVCWLAEIPVRTRLAEHALEPLIDAAKKYAAEHGAPPLNAHDFPPEIVERYRLSDLGGSGPKDNDVILVEIDRCRILGMLPFFCVSYSAAEDKNDGFVVSFMTDFWNSQFYRSCDDRWARQD